MVVVKEGRILGLALTYSSSSSLVAPPCFSIIVCIASASRSTVPRFGEVGWEGDGARGFPRGSFFWFGGWSKRILLPLAGVFGRGSVPSSGLGTESPVPGGQAFEGLTRPFPGEHGAGGGPIRSRKCPARLCQVPRRAVRREPAVKGDVELSQTNTPGNLRGNPLGFRPGPPFPRPPPPPPPPPAGAGAANPAERGHGLTLVAPARGRGRLGSRRGAVCAPPPADFLTAPGAAPPLPGPSRAFWGLIPEKPTC